MMAGSHAEGRASKNSGPRWSISRALARGERTPLGRVPPRRRAAPAARPSGSCVRLVLGLQRRVLFEGRVLFCLGTRVGGGVFLGLGAAVASDASKGQ